MGQDCHKTPSLNYAQHGANRRSSQSVRSGASSGSCFRFAAPAHFISCFHEASRYGTDSKETQRDPSRTKSPREITLKQPVSPEGNATRVPFRRGVRSAPPGGVSPRPIYSLAGHSLRLGRELSFGIAVTPFRSSSVGLR